MEVWKDRVHRRGFLVVRLSFCRNLRGSNCICMVPYTRVVAFYRSAWFFDTVTGL